MKLLSLSKLGVDFPYRAGYNIILETGAEK